MVCQCICKSDVHLDRYIDCTCHLEHGTKIHSDMMPEILSLYI